MPSVESLVESRESPTVKFCEFMRIVSKGKDYIPAFFEGEDEKYYTGRLNTIRPDLDCPGINCGGKSIVIRLRNDIRKHPEYCAAACMFFVDADFDDNSNLKEHSDVYVTPCYSVENLYMSSSVFKKILSSEFGITEHGTDRDCFAKALAVYADRKKEFLSHISDFNYWVHAYRQMEKSSEVQKKLNINNIKLFSLVKISLDAVSQADERHKIDDLFSESDRTATIDLKSSVEHFRSISKEKWFRGKQNIEFLRQFILRLKQDRCEKSGRVVFEQKGNVKLNLTKANIISELSQYADTPDRLSAFLKRYEIPVKLEQQT